MNTSRSRRFSRGRTRRAGPSCRSELRRFDALKPIEAGPVLAATDVGPIAPPTMIPGERKQEPIEPGFLSALDPRRPGSSHPPRRLDRPAGGWPWRAG